MTFKICGDAAKSRRRGGERGSALLHYHHVSELEKHEEHTEINNERKK